MSVFTAAASTAPADGAAARVRFGVTAVAWRRFAGGGRRIDDAFSQRHFTDLTRAYELSYRPEQVSAAGNTFAAMAVTLHGAVCADGDAVELGFVAHVTPDLDCRLAASTYLANALPGVRLSFGITDNGSCAAYTALRLARLYAARHGYHRVLVLALDQAAMPYDVRLPVGLHPAGDAGVALLLTTDGTGAPLDVRQRARVGAGQVPDTVREILHGMGVPRAPVRLVDGTGVVPDGWAAVLDGVKETLIAPAGYRATATWGQLAASWSEDELLATVLIDYDRITEDLGVCVIGPRADTP